MSTPTYISAGSSTRVVTGPGKLYGVHITPGAGGSVLIADSLNFGAAPNFNADTATGLIGRFGPYSGQTTDWLDFKGAHVNDGLVIAATSTSRLTVLTD